MQPRSIIMQSQPRVAGGVQQRQGHGANGRDTDPRKGSAASARHCAFTSGTSGKRQLLRAPPEKLRSTYRSLQRPPQSSSRPQTGPAQSKVAQLNLSRLRHFAFGPAALKTHVPWTEEVHFSSSASALFGCCALSSRDHCDSLQHYALLLIWTSQDCVIVYCCCSLFDTRKMLQNVMSLQTLLQLSNREDQLLRQAPRLGLWPANTTHMHIPPISPSRTFGFSGGALDGISLSRLAWEPNPRLLQTIESWSSAASHFHQKAYENWVSGRLPWTMNVFILGPRR